MLKYEKKVFSSVGAWKSMEEMEECLSIDELLHSYEGVMDTEWEMQKMIARAMGAEINEEVSEKPEAKKKESVFDRARKKMDEKHKKPSRMPNLTGYTGK